MGFLSGLFGKKEKLLPPADLSVLGTDVHSHFIPGIDDGATTIEDSLTLIEAMHNFGYKKVITTPHIMSDYYKNTPEIILGGLEKVKKAVKKQGINIEVEAAAEYYLDHTLEEKIKNKSLLTFGDNYVLFELPFVGEPPNLNETIFELQTAGYKPVLAHVERYGFWYNNYEKYQELYERGTILQLNTNSITGHYSPECKKASEHLIDEGLIQLLGSDCHHTGHLGLIEQARQMPYFHKLLESGDLLNSTL